MKRPLAIAAAAVALSVVVLAVRAAGPEVRVSLHSVEATGVGTIDQRSYKLDHLGAVHSCGDIDWPGDVTVHWGAITAAGDISIDKHHRRLPVSLPRVVSPDLPLDALYGWDDEAAWDSYYKDILESSAYPIEDPWFRLIAGGNVEGPPNDGSSQPWPFTWVPGQSLESGDIPFHPYQGSGPGSVKHNWDGTHSNVLQHTNVGCPSFPYGPWKELAENGGLGIHYYEWVAEDLFSENGTGPPERFRDITDEVTGLYFFDTADANAPRDDDADGVFDNLTPPIRITAGTWGFRGAIYLNAAEFQIKNVKGREVTYAAPREPYGDEDQDGKYDVGERWLNLDYPTQLEPQGGTLGRFFAKAESGPNDTHEQRGPEFTGSANIWGVFYTSGAYDPSGAGVVYGSLTAFEGIGGSTGAGTTRHYYDQTMEEDLPIPPFR